MKQLLILLVVGIAITDATRAQDFITGGKIEFEVKRNLKKMTADQHPEAEMELGGPEFETKYRTLAFSSNKLLYSTAGKGGVGLMANEATLYTDLDTRHYLSKQNFMAEEVLLGDSIRPVKWKIENEVRKIAGFECRKAIGRYQDSMYVVAFYCPEIIPQGGPEYFTGLPGMILGLAIPRLYTTWFATRVEMAGPDELKITPPTLKNGRVYNRKELGNAMYNKYKDSGWSSDLTIEKVLSFLDVYTFY